MPSNRLLPLLVPLAAGLLLNGTCTAAYPTPKEYEVRIRYKIRAYRTERIRQFERIVRYFESLGFDKDEGPADEEENPDVTLMTGTIPAAGARKLLLEPHVQSILLLPKGAKLPAGAGPVRVDLELPSLLRPEQVRRLTGEAGCTSEEMDLDLAALRRQALLAEQVRTVLKDLGFREAAGYDDRWHTRLLGMVPANKLDALLTDLRQQPSGTTLPAPFAGVWPLRAIEAQTLLPFPAQQPVPLLPPRGQEKIAPELRALLADEAAAAKPVRMEIILAVTPAGEGAGWRNALETAAPDLSVEGRLGPLVTGTASARSAVALAALPDVSTVRLPRSGEQPSLPGTGKAEARAALAASGVAKLHSLGHRGKGVRVAIVDSDFRGWRALLGKGLPARTAFVDLTQETNRGLQPGPFPGEASAIGHGTAVAEAAARAAPAAEFTLIRIDPAAPYQLEQAARAISGESFMTEGLRQRDRELQADREALDERSRQVFMERQALLNQNVSLDPDLAKHPGDFGLDPVQDKALIARQQAWVKAQAALEQDERAYRDRLQGYVQFWAALRGLRGIHVVASSLVWDEGYPADGSSALSRWFDDRPFHAALWLQAAGDTRGQSWSGLFRDVDGDGRMEFTPPCTPHKDSLWTNQLNALAWQPAGGARAADLPAGARLRVSIQWQEAHDPEFLRHGEDLYRSSLANLNLVVLRQLDPSGATRPADDLEVVAQSVSLPQRLTNEPASATYEQTVEFTVKQPGRYLVRVEGRIPEGIRPPGEPTLPAIQQTGEIRPRLFVQTLEGPGRAVLADYATAMGSLGVPADARQVITVGAASLAGKGEPYSAGGPPHNVELLAKPDVLAYDAMSTTEQGTGMATGFAAGLAASALSAGVPRCRFLEELQVPPGGVLRVPSRWLARRGGE
jgi:hypothetical protein